MEGEVTAETSIAENATGVRNSWIPVLTGRFVLFIALLAVIVLVLPSDWSGLGFLALNGGAVLLGLGDFLLTPRPSKITVTRELPQVLSLGQEGRIVWAVSNPGDRRLRVGVADALVPSWNATRRRSWLHVPKKGRAFFDAQITPSRRGLFEISEITVRVLGPLGLFGRQGRRQLSSVLRVYPPFRSKREAELRIDKARIIDVGLRSVRAHGGGTEFEQLREYTVDDDFRRIDWAATARAHKPIVRTYRAERNQNVVLLLDTGRVMAGRVNDVPRLEHAMDSVLALSTVASRLGDRVGLIAFDRVVRAEVAANHGPRQTAHVTEALYRLEPQLVESDYRGVFVHTLTRFRRRSLVVVLTELAEQAVGESLLPALPLLARDHFVVVASVADPDVTTWSRAVPDETSKAFQKASAIKALEDRRRTVALLRARGVTVVDAVPGKLAARLADTYLEVKATGRL